MVADRIYRNGETGTVTVGRDSAWAILTHDSPPDQESIELLLTEDFICLESGEVAEFQRHEFTPDR